MQSMVQRRRGKDTEKWKRHLGIYTVDKQFIKRNLSFYWLPSLVTSTLSWSKFFGIGLLQRLWEVESKGILLMQSSFTLTSRATINLDAVYSFVCDTVVFYHLTSPEWLGFIFLYLTVCIYTSCLRVCMQLCDVDCVSQSVVWELIIYRDLEVRTQVYQNNRIQPMERLRKLRRRRK